MTKLRPGMNDRELAGYMEYVWKREGSNRSSFAPIVSSGPNAMTFFSVLRENYTAVDRVMKAGDLVFVDYGAAEFNMYTADLCRTWPVSGKFTPEQRTYYDMVLEAQEAAIAAIKPGVMMVDVIKVAARVFQKHGLERYEDVATMGEDKVSENSAPTARPIRVKPSCALLTPSIICRSGIRARNAPVEIAIRKKAR